MPPAGRTPTYRNPVYEGYFADPYVVRWENRYVAYGTGSVLDGLTFEILLSDDLATWSRVGGALEPIPDELGTDCWAPEVVEADGRWWMYYSVGFDDVGHHLRVAVADSPMGPFADLAVNLTPQERFAIDPHPFQDADGTWYLYYARDVLEGERAGTQLAVDRMDAMTSLTGSSMTVLSATSDWQLFQRGRSMYGGTYDWHTLEGPAVLLHDGSYYLFYSGGSWQGEGYAVAWARADHPLGPWLEPPPQAGRLLQTVPHRVRGPGHNSLVTTDGGTDMIIYHAWNDLGTRRQLWMDPLVWDLRARVWMGPAGRNGRCRPEGTNALDMRR
jgi:arabinan endo-1,5-alpha-L-arabinosidase